MPRCQHSFLKNPSNLWVVHIGSNSFQGISYDGKPQVVFSYSFKSIVRVPNNDFPVLQCLCIVLSILGIISDGIGKYLSKI